MIASRNAPVPAYHQLRLVSLLGETTDFAWAGSKASAVRTVGRDAAALWWQATLLVLAKLRENQPALAGWIDRIGGGSVPEDPLGTVWHALLQAQGLPPYPLRFSAGEEGAQQWHTACPYDELTRQSLLLSLQLLLWGQETAHYGRLTIARDRLAKWRQVFGALADMHPSAAEMALHHALWQSSISWQWLGGTRTRIGQGARQVVAENHAAAPASLDDPDQWRIPIYTITGSIGKTTTARMLWQVLSPSVKGLALTASDGAWIGEVQVAVADCIGGRSARGLLQAPQVEAAVFEQGRGGLIAQGVPYARSDIAILLNIDDVHVGIDGIATLEQIADVKAVGLRPARIAVLNHDDAQCRRIGALRDPEQVVWFSLAASADELATISAASHGALGIDRLPDGTPLAVAVWRGGERVRTIALDGVAPFHGMLGEKTLEELLAVVAAGWFGPIALDDAWEARLRALRLDGSNHVFRTSVHRAGETVYVLDKAGEASSLRALRTSLDHLTARETIARRIVVVSRSASEVPERHIESMRHLHAMGDEFVCYDRPETYVSAIALPIYQPGSVPKLLGDALASLNAETGTAKPITVVADWAAVEAHLTARLPEVAGKRLVLVNQPATAAIDLNTAITAFVRRHEAEALAMPVDAA
jgi:hypothetical protein